MLGPDHPSDPFPASLIFPYIQFTEWDGVDRQMDLVCFVLDASN
jgi:hypothetical protein